jgi:hypothetical protein
MSEINDLKATRERLRDLARIVQVTRQALATMIRENDWPDGQLSNGRSGQFADTLEHIGEVREGFILSQRISPQATMSELKGLVEDILLDWKWVQELNLSIAPSSQLEPLGEQLVVYNHALVAMSVLPRLPSNVVTFPQRSPTYIDLTAPTVPNEVLARIEEIERIIYQAEISPARRLDYGSFRRTYAFFEASHWLDSNYLKSLLDE